MFHIVLFRPEIPPNTGNVIRLSANTGCTLHLVRPLGFDLEGKAVRRAGLDYDELATVRIHRSLDECLSCIANDVPPWMIPSSPGGQQHRGLAELPGARVFSVETSGERVYSDVS